MKGKQASGCSGAGVGIVPASVLLFLFPLRGRVGPAPVFISWNKRQKFDEAGSFFLHWSILPPTLLCVLPLTGEGVQSSPSA